MFRAPTPTIPDSGHRNVILVTQLESRSDGGRGRLSRRAVCTWGGGADASPFGRSTPQDGQRG